MIGMPDEPVYAILTNSKAENVNANSVNIAVVDGKTITQTVDLGAAKTGLPVRIKAVQGGKYIIGEGEKGFAPENLTIKRVGKNLHIALEGTDPDQAQLIIENFEGSGGQLVGLAEDGSYYEFISSDADQDGSAAFLYDGAESAQVLGAQPLAGFGNGLVAGAGIGWFWPALLGLGALGLLGGVYAAVRNKDNDNDRDTPVGGGNGDKGSLGGVIDDVGDKQGLIGPGESTDDKTPTFTGVGKPGTTVEIVDNGKVIGTAPVGEDGKWEFTPAEPGLVDGSHNIVIVPVDADGNKGEPSPGHIIIVDTVAPAAPLIDGVYDDTAPKEGLLAAGDSTNDTTPTLKGTAEAGAIVHIYDNGVEIGTAIADKDGKWEFTPEVELVEGDHEFTIAAEDAAGNISVPSLPFPIVIDITAPEKPGPGTGGIDDIYDNVGPEQGGIGDGDSTDDKTPTFTGSGATPGDIVVIIDNGTPIGSVVVGEDGKWEFTPEEDTELEPGSHEIVVVIKDPAGNESEPSDPITIIVVEDTTPPVKPTPGEGGIEIITDDVGDKQGIIYDGDSTDDTAPTFGGSGAVPGDIVTIIDNGTPIGSVVVGEDGNWEFTPGAGEELAEGSHEIVVVIKDPSGNESEPSDPITIIVDTLAPEVPTLGSVFDDQGTSTGNLFPGDITDDASPDVTGTAEPGSLVILYSNGSPVGSIYASADGSWTITPNLPLSNGSHTLTVTSTDAAGNESAPTPGFDLEVVAGGLPTAPAIVSVVDDQGESTGNLQKDQATDDAQPTVNGTGNDGDIITLYANGVAVGSTTVVDGQWSITPETALGEGLNDLTAQAKNAAGNLSPETGAYPINIDTTAPVAPGEQTLTDDIGPITGEINNGTVTDDANPTFAGMAEPGALVFIYDNGGTTPIGSVRADASGAWKITLPNALENGPHSLTARAQDSAGNLGPAGPAINFEVDTSAVVISITSVVDDEGTSTGNLLTGQSTDDTTPTLKGNATPGSLVTVYDGDTVVGSVVAHPTTGAWEVTTTALSEGAHNLTATSTTEASGESAPTPVFDIIIDTTAPTAPAIGQVTDDVGTVQGDVPTGTVTDDTTPTLSGEGLEAGSTVEIYDGGMLIGTEKVGADGRWTHTTTPLNDGSHSLTVVARDPAGNASTPSAPWVVIVDTVGPVAVITSLSDNVGTGTPTLPETIANGGETDDRSPVINGTTEPGAIVTIYANGVELGSAEADASGVWTFEPAEPLELGAYSLTATATDAAGNTGPESALFEFDLVSVFHRPVITDEFPGAAASGGIVAGPAYDAGAFTITRQDVTGHPLTASGGDLITLANSSASRGETKLIFDMKGEESNTLSLQLSGRVSDGAGSTIPPALIVGQIKFFDANGHEVHTHDIVYGELVGSPVLANFTTIDVPDGKTFASFEITQFEAPPGASMNSTLFVDNIIVSDNLPIIIDEFPGAEASGGIVAGPAYDAGLFTITRQDVTGHPATASGGDVISLVNSSTSRGETKLVFDMKGEESSTISLQLAGRVHDALGSTISPELILGQIKFLDASGHEVYTHNIVYGELTYSTALADFTTINIPDGKTFASFEITQFEAPPGAYMASYLYIDNIVLSSVDTSGSQGVDTVESANAEQIVYVEQGDEATIAAEGTDAIDTLTLNGANQVLDLTALAEGQVTSMEVIDITGTGNNTLNLSLSDVLAQGGNSLFTGDDSTQMMIKGNAGDVVNLADLLPDGTDPGDWASAGTATVAGVVYNVYQHSSQDAQLLVQDGVTTNLV